MDAWMAVFLTSMIIPGSVEGFFSEVGYNIMCAVFNIVLSFLSEISNLTVGLTESLCFSMFA